MSVLRYIAILSFMALITGCEADDYECTPPGYPSFPNCPTNFLFKVIDVDPDSGQVEVVYSEKIPYLKKDPRPANKKWAAESHKIYVRDLETLVKKGRLVKGKEYVFHNGNGSPFFEVFPEGHVLLNLPNENGH
jgi:hypothetical protein